MEIHTAGQPQPRRIVGKRRQVDEVSLTACSWNTKVHVRRIVYVARWNRSVYEFAPIMRDVGRPGGCHVAYAGSFSHRRVVTASDTGQGRRRAALSAGPLQRITVSGSVVLAGMVRGLPKFADAETQMETGARKSSRRPVGALAERKHAAYLLVDGKDHRHITRS